MHKSLSSPLLGVQEVSTCHVDLPLCIHQMGRRIRARSFVIHGNMRVCCVNSCGAASGFDAWVGAKIESCRLLNT